jgi:hypothetical protein
VIREILPVNDIISPALLETATDYGKGCFNFPGHIKIIAAAFHDLLRKEIRFPYFHGRLQFSIYKDDLN